MKFGGVKVNPTIALVSMPNAETEYSYTLPDFTTKFNIQGTHQLQIAVVSGESGSNYILITVESGGWTENIKGRIVGLTLYLQSAFSGVTAKIISWQN